MLKPGVKNCLTQDVFLKSGSYTVLRLLTGFAVAAFMAWKLTVINAMDVAVNPARVKTHQLI